MMMSVNNNNGKIEINIIEVMDWVDVGTDRVKPQRREYETNFNVLPYVNISR